MNINSYTTSVTFSGLCRVIRDQKKLAPVNNRYTGSPCLGSYVEFKHIYHRVMHKRYIHLMEIFQITVKDEY